MASSAACPEGDDSLWLSLLLAQPTSAKARESLTWNALESLSSRFVGDTASHMYKSKYWEELVESSRSNGFETECARAASEEDARAGESQCCTAGSIDTSELPAEFQTDAGKTHLAAVCSLLGVSPSRAASMTTSAVGSKQPKAAAGEEPPETDGGAKGPSSAALLGTRRLLLSVRNFHYEQQVARVRFVAEALRKEKQDVGAEEAAEPIRGLTVRFLDRLDDTARTAPAAGRQSRRRGLIRLLLSLACAPVQNLQSGMLFPSSSLARSPAARRAGDSADAALALCAALPSHDFSKRLMEDHMAHYDARLRTEALEALVALLYERIEGGVSRGDYMLLLLAFRAQDFFRERPDHHAHPDHHRRTQLSALIMAESLSLWRFHNQHSDPHHKHERSILSHPFFDGGQPSLQRQLHFIGRDIFINDFAPKILQRQRSSSSDTLQAPEAIAMLTFGVILKLASQKIAPSTDALSPFMKELGFQCVSIANDQCGAFAYLETIMSNLLPPSILHDAFQDAENTMAEQDHFHWTFHALGNSHHTTNAPETHLLSQETHHKQEVNSALTIVYASIGREILVGTLGAFKNSLLCNDSTSREDNIGMFCNLAAQIYQNNSILCDSFWDNWDSYCSRRPANCQGKASQKIVNGPDTDSIYHLLDAAYTLASTAITTHILDNGGSESPWMNGHLSASILPSFMPLLRLISCIIPCHGGNVCDVVSIFFPDYMAHVCLQGCCYLSSLNDMKPMGQDLTVFQENERLLQAALCIMTSLHNIARLMSKHGGEHGIDLLRNEMEPADSKMDKSLFLSSPILLYNIAYFGLHNVNFNKNQRAVLASSALGTMTEMLRCESANDFLWTSQVSKCLCQNNPNVMRVGFSLFVEEGMEEVTAFSMTLLRKMSLNVTKFVASSPQENNLMEYLSTVENGAHTACKLLLTITSSAEQHPIAYGAISSIFIIMRALTGIVEWHKIESLKERAKKILGELIQTLSSSSTLQGTLGYYATLPVAVGLASIAETHAEFINKCKNRASDESHTSSFPSLIDGKENGIKQDAYISSLIQKVGRIPLPYDNDSKIQLTVFKIAQSSMALLLLWSKISERFAMEDHTEFQGYISLPEVSDDLDADHIQDIQSNLQSNGPVCVLLSCPVPPITENMSTSYYGPANRIHVFNLIARYIGWCCEDDNGPSKLKTDMAVKAVKLISMGMIHANLSKSQETKKKNGSNSLLDNINPASIRSMGSQVQYAHFKLFKCLPRDRDCEEFSQSKFALTLHLLNMLSRSVVFLPTLAKDILEGQSMSTECKLIDLIIETLLPARVSSSTVALIASSCANVLHQLWNSCRDNCSIFRHSKSPVLLHPCDGVFASLYSKHTVVKTCSMALLNYQLTINKVKIASLRHENDMTEEPSDAYVKSAILNIMSKSLQILGKEAILSMREDAQQSATYNDMQDFLKNVFDQNLIEKVYQSMSCFDGAIFSARSLSSLHISRSSNYEFGSATLINIPLAIDITSLLSSVDDYRVLSKALVTAHSAAHVVRCQADILSSLSQFGQIAALTSKDGTRLESARFMMIDQAMIPIRQSAENSYISFSLAPPSHRRFITAQTLDIAYELTSSLASHLSELVANPSNQARHLICILEDLLRSSERYLIIVESPFAIQSQHAKYLVCRLRLNILLSSLLLVDAIKDIESSLSQDEQKRYNINRQGLCRVVGDTLNSLSFVKPDTTELSTESHNGQFQYDFSSEISHDMNYQMTNTSGVSLNLLRVAISLLSALLPATLKTSPSFSCNACETELAITFRNCNLIPLVLQHLDIASDAAASTYQMFLHETSGKSIETSCIHKNSVDIITRIFHFAHCVADCGGKQLPRVMLENRFVQTLTRCKIFSYACRQWSASTQGDLNKSQRERGYLKTKHVTRFDSSKDLYQGNHPCRKLDPVHNIWRSAIQILTALIRSWNSTKYGSLDNANTQCALAIIDFISTFEDNILSCIQNCSFRTSEGAPSSEFGFTVNLLNEVCDTLSLLSELCNGENRQQFEKNSLHFYMKVRMAALDIVKTLSTFMGAVGTARELFSILSNLKKYIAGDGNGDDESTAARHEAFITHPLMADGVSNARHEEIRNALYASSCCIPMTDDEYALSQSKMKSSAISLIDKRGAAMNLGQVCQNHLDNDFTLLIEGIVAQCVFNALSIIQKVHPAASCFVCFDQNDAIHLNLTSIPPSGAIVAVRPNAPTTRMSSYLCVSDTRYGRIVDYNAMKRTFDVHYFYSSTLSKAPMVEKQIPLLRLAGIEDVSKRKSMLEVYPAPNSVSETTSDNGTDNGSLGDLIQILRWCRQRASGEINEDLGIQIKLVKGIAESASMLLGNEVGIHQELGSFTCISEDNLKELNRQLLVLFDDEESKVNRISFEAHSSNNCLMSLIDADVWVVVLQQLDSLLSSGRVEREKIRKALDENGAHLLSWGRNIQKGERRSPFKMTFVKR